MARVGQKRWLAKQAQRGGGGHAAMGPSVSRGRGGKGGGRGREGARTSSRSASSARSAPNSPPLSSRHVPPASGSAATRSTATAPPGAEASTAYESRSSGRARPSGSGLSSGLWGRCCCGGGGGGGSSGDIATQGACGTVRGRKKEGEGGERRRAAQTIWRTGSTPSSRSRRARGSRRGTRSAPPRAARRARRRASTRRAARAPPRAGARSRRRRRRAAPSSRSPAPRGRRRAPPAAGGRRRGAARAPAAAVWFFGGVRGGVCVWFVGEGEVLEAANLEGPLQGHKSLFLK